MKDNKVHYLINLQHKPVFMKGSDSSVTNRLIYGIKQLPRKDQEVLMTIVDAFLHSRGQERAE